MAIAVQSLSLPCHPSNPSLTSSFSSHLKLLTLRSFCFSSNLSHNLFAKGCPSMSTINRPIRLSVICMARRYGANSRKRKIKSRKRGGDPGKKRKRKRKIPRRNKDKFKIVRLVSAAGTGYVYAKRKGKKKSEKLEIKKYDPNVKCYVLFKESK